MCNIETDEKCCQKPWTAEDVAATASRPYEADVSHLNGTHTGSKIRVSVAGGATITDRVVRVHHVVDEIDEAQPFKTWVMFQNVRPQNNQLRMGDDAFLVYGHFEVID